MQYVPECLTIYRQCCEDFNYCKFILVGCNVKLETEFNWFGECKSILRTSISRLKFYCGRKKPDDFVAMNLFFDESLFF
jgi:hypothetical protein